MNWGYKIMIVYLLFVLGIVFLVYKASHEQVDLVTTDYYAKELKYQQNIDEVKRTNALTVPVDCKINGQQLAIYFPKDFSGKNIKGILALYCPSDEKKDLKQDFETSELNTTLIIPGHPKGWYVLQLSWQADGLSYYFEKKLML